MRTWIIRYSDMHFTRPMDEDELIKDIEAGNVTPQDEIAASNGYWFSIQDVEEVKAHFGERVNLKALLPTGTETTSSTNTALLTGAPPIDPATGTVKVAKTTAAKKTQRTAKSGETRMEITPVKESNYLFGGLLTLIFLSTLLLLWMGSQ